MSRVEKAVDSFKSCNCAQAILSTFGEEYGLERKDAMRTAAAFGGGIARTGGICGAVSGALMVLGLKYGKGPESKEKIIAASREFMENFAARAGSTTCKDLLGCDLNTAEGRQYAKDNNLFTTLCPRYVRQAARLLEELPCD